MDAPAKLKTRPWSVVASKEWHRCNDWFFWPSSPPVISVLNCSGSVEIILNSELSESCLLISYNALSFCEDLLWFCSCHVGPPIIAPLMHNAVWFSITVLLTMCSYTLILWLFGYCPHDGRDHASVLSQCHNMASVQNSTWQNRDPEAKNMSYFNPLS